MPFRHQGGRDGVKNASAASESVLGSGIPVFCGGCLFHDRILGPATRPYLVSKASARSFRHRCRHRRPRAPPSGKSRRASATPTGTKLRLVRRATPPWRGALRIAIAGCGERVSPRATARARIATSPWLRMLLGRRASSSACRHAMTSIGAGTNPANQRCWLAGGRRSIRLELRRLACGSALTW